MFIKFIKKKMKAWKLWVINYSYEKYHMFEENFKRKLHLHCSVKVYQNNKNKKKHFYSENRDNIL